jgi:hypothetical protein
MPAAVAPGESLLVPRYEVIRGNIHRLYGGMEIEDISLVRLTRDVEVEIGDEAMEGWSGENLPKIYGLIPRLSSVICSYISCTLSLALSCD